MDTLNLMKYKTTEYSFLFECIQIKHVFEVYKREQKGMHKTADDLFHT